MNQLKRKLSFNRLSNEEENRKSRTDLIEIENLSDELFYEIFDYLDSHEIYHAFSNLNHRFEQLLNSSSLLFKIQHHHVDCHPSYSNNYKQFLLLNKSKIFSIKLSYDFGKNDFISFFTIDSSLIHLESLYIEINQSDLLLSLLMNLSSLPRLFSLTIIPYYHPKNLHDIYRLTFLLPTLKSFMHFLDKKHHSVRLPIPTNEQLSPIEYLTISHFCTFSELFSILAYTPQLRRLKLYNSINIDISIETLLPITLTNLTEMWIPMNSVKFDEFERLIRKIIAKLKVLHVTTQAHDPTFLHAYRWEQLICQSLPQLEEFYLTYQSSISSEGVNPFSSAFWIQRQWLFEVELTSESVNYLIRPFRKRWYEDSSLDYSKSTRLTITYPDESVVKYDTPCVLTRTQIYHLETTEEIHMNVLIGALNLLPTLQTLKIHSFSLHQSRILNTKERLILSSFEDTSEITKVYLQKMNQIEEFDYLLQLCPYMEYLRVDGMKHLDFKFVLRYICKKIQDHDHLRLLCFRVPTVDDEMIVKLKRMIHLEKLLSNYTIQRLADQIVFHLSSILIKQHI